MGHRWGGVVRENGGGGGPSKQKAGIEKLQKHQKHHKGIEITQIILCKVFHLTHIKFGKKVT